MSSAEAFLELVNTVRELRGPGGCPWDKEQTFNSLTPYVIEEAYELVDVLKKNDSDGITEELGDVLLHVIMIALMGEETHQFSLVDVIRSINAKMIRRHPHVFGPLTVSTSDEVIHHWESIKSAENSMQSKGLLDSIPRHLPAIMQAQKIQKKVSKIGFDWPTISGTLQKLEEELDELKTALTAGDRVATTDEFGDVLFTVVNIGRKLNIDCEAALQSTNGKFRDRFTKMESNLANRNIRLDTASFDQLDAHWKEAKETL
ncbi:nucleoside triphosphate pyrophosphohydrolase [bacterium]|nr:nucleoside triphosphate pyrophosphohydrolase [bacterium]